MSTPTKKQRENQREKFIDDLRTAIESYAGRRAIHANHTESQAIASCANWMARDIDSIIRRHWRIARRKPHA